jgi:urate oxidase
VNIYLITTDTMKNVIQAIQKKQEQFMNMKQFLLNVTQN